MPDQSPAIPTGDHAPVSNQPDEAAPVEEEELSDPPSEGVDAQANPVTKEGIEVVPGYTPILPEVRKLSVVPESAAAAKSHKEVVDQLAGLLTAPDTHGLPDIGEASFGAAPALEVVLGVDDRTQIIGTSAYPWRVHASLLITAADNSQWIGTGWFIGPHTLMTAGHCVFIKNSGVPGRDGWVKKITVMPGRNGGVLPYGSVISTSFRSVVGWTTSGDQNYDYGAIIIPTELGNTTGWFGFGVWSDADVGRIDGEHLRIPRRQALRHPVVSRAEDRVCEQPEGVLRHRHRGRPERERRLPDHQRSPLRGGDSCLRRSHSELGDANRDAGLQQHARVEGVTRKRLPRLVRRAPWPT